MPNIGRIALAGRTFLLLSIVLAGLSACTETVHRVPSMTAEAPASQAEPADGGLSQKSSNELLDLGFGYLKAGNPALARLHFTAALKRDPKSAWAYIGLGDIDYLAANYPAALASYKQAGVLDPRNLDAILGQVQTLRQQGNLNGAGEQIGRAMAIAPNDVRVLTELAINYDLQGQGNLATPLFQEIAVKAPDQAATYNNLGVNQLFRGEYAEAVASLSRARMINSADERIRNNLAMALALTGEEDRALALFRETVGEAAAWNNLGYLYMTRQRYDDAERALRKALDLSPRFYPRAQENLDRLNRLRQAGR